MQAFRIVRYGSGSELAVQVFAVNPSPSGLEVATPICGITPADIDIDPLTGTSKLVITPPPVSPSDPWTDCEGVDNLEGIITGLLEGSSLYTPDALAKLCQDARYRAERFIRNGEVLPGSYI